MVKLDKISCKLLYELDQNCRLPDVSIAKRIGRSRESVRYRIDQLLQKGVIRKFRAIINYNKVGYQGYELYLNLTGTVKERDEFRNFVLKLGNIYWLGVSEGVWDIGITIYAKSHQEFFEKKEKIFEKYRKLIIKKSAVVVVYELVFPKKYLHGKKSKPLKLFGDVAEFSLDEMDHKIISVLRDDARISLVKLAQKTNSTVDIVRGRMKKMEQRGIILKYTLEVDYNKLNLHLFKVFLYFNEFSKTNENKLIEYCTQKTEISHYGRYVSPWEVELDIMVDSFQSFNKLIRDIKDEFADILLDTEASSVSEEYLLP